jgi:hypothetical protein
MSRRTTLRSVTRSIIVSAAVLVAAAACSSSGAPGADPNNRMLNELAKDPLLVSLPPGATRTAFIKDPAVYRKEPFGGEGWDGPSVQLRFDSPAPIGEVLRYYDQLALRHGWTRANKSGRYKLTVTWTKAFPGAKAGALVLPDDPRATTAPRAYTVRASITTTRHNH